MSSIQELKKLRTTWKSRITKASTKLKEIQSPFDGTTTILLKTIESTLKSDMEHFKKSHHTLETAQIREHPTKLENIIEENSDYSFEVEFMYNHSINKINMIVEEINLSNQLESITSNVNAIINSITKYDPSTSDIHNIKTWSIAIEKYRGEFLTTCERRKSLSLTIEDIPAKEELFELNYLKYKAILTKLEDNLKVTDIKSETKPTNSHSRFVKLPELKLPTFDGQYTNWMSFKAQFESRVMQHVTNNCDRLEYLRSSLIGKAALSIKGLEGREEDFVIAWKLLKDTYQNEKIIINSHLQQIDNLKTPESESASSLQKFIETFLCHYEALKGLEAPVKHWDILLIYILSKKLDSSTRREVEIKTPSNKNQTLEEFIDTLKERRRILEALEKTSSKSKPKNVVASNSTFVSLSHYMCPACNMSHSIYQCTKFQNMDHEEKEKTIKEKKLCYNCLRPNHQIKNCFASGCKICNRKHNTLLHISKSKQPLQTKPLVSPETEVQNQSTPSAEASTSNCAHALHGKKQIKHIWLATALIEVEDAFGNYHTYRCLLDSGSQSNFITTAAMQQLGIKTIKSNTAVSGIHKSTTNIQYKTQVTIRSKYTSFTVNLDCLVIDKITGLIPTQRIEFSQPSVPNLQLADPNFNYPGKIDVLIGAEQYHNIVKGRIIEQSLRFQHCGIVN